MEIPAVRLLDWVIVVRSIIQLTDLVSRIEDGTVFRQVIIHQAVPFLVGIQVAALNVRALVVAEVLHHAERNIVACSATAAWLEFHIHGIRHVAHQQRHCIPLRLVACYHLALRVLLVLPRRDTEKQTSRFGTALREISSARHLTTTKVLQGH